MNFVNLVEALRVECGVSGSPLQSVANVGGELNRLKKWIGDAWYELQTSKEDWKFLRADYSFALQPNQQFYTPTDAGLPTLDRWKQDSPWIEDTTLGLPDQQPLGWMEWTHFREMYIRGPQNPQRPMCYTVHPNLNLYFGPLPDKAYNVTGEAWLAPTKLVLDTDTPNMPERFHMAIVYEAMKKYAGYESANDVMTRAMREARPLMGKLMQNQLPDMTVDGSL